MKSMGERKRQIKAAVQQQVRTEQFEEEEEDGDKKKKMRQKYRRNHLQNCLDQKKPLNLEVIQYL